MKKKSNFMLVAVPNEFGTNLEWLYMGPWTEEDENDYNRKTN